MPRRLFGFLLSFCLAGLSACPALAAESAPPVEAVEGSIPFANRGGERDWVVVDDRNLLLRDRQGQWFCARLLSPAYYLAYAQGLRFATGPSGTLEKFDSVIVRGEKFPIVSLTRCAAPEIRAK